MLRIKMAKHLLTIIGQWKNTFVYMALSTHQFILQHVMAMFKAWRSSWMPV